MRRVRHESLGLRHCALELESRKFRCMDCSRTFWQRFPGILPRRRATEPFRRSIYLRHWDGISRRRLGQREGIGSATVERWFQDFLQRAAAERTAAPCPRVLGIDKHFFSRRRHDRNKLAASPAERSRCVQSNAIMICGERKTAVTLDWSTSADIPRSSNGRTAAFGAVNRGSNPCRGANNNSRTHNLNPQGLYATNGGRPRCPN